MDTPVTTFEIAHTGEVQPGAEVKSHREWLREPGRRAFRPRQIVIDNPESWAVRQLTIVGRPQIPSRDGRAVDVPAVVFAGAALELDQVEPGDRVQIVAVNLSDKPAQLFARLIGEPLPELDSPAPAPALPPES